MFRRRTRGQPASAWREPFDRALALVERATAALVSAAPRGRPSPVSLAEALAGFEADLRRAGEALEGWTPTDHRDGAEACREAVAESLRRAERLRLEGSPEGYEELVDHFDRLLEPLTAFERAAEELGRAG
jgi:hypothetical protein